MQTIQFLHSYWAYLVVLVVFLATFNALVGFFSKTFLKESMAIKISELASLR